MTLVDTNVLIDLVTADPNWLGWSAARINEAIDRGPLLINDVIYAEISTRFDQEEQLEVVLRTIGIVVAPIPRSALFLAGKAFVQYRRSGGVKTRVLSDFLIGAHAATEHLSLLTRDARHYRTYFPNVDLITPDRG
ncbi:type II toxin-antitoxin system VapC family toxin [Rhodopseudomonas pseudopalustris]|uniref:PilT protein-like n=2 Tax=Rhodopseudomonas TaxID=1073 RepID=Q13E04_RHOPS|nr:type II toxin-antitoxin system VapC family toxin [Rhodopseudomonas pseudopalustris]ABE37685.1 PilT protein-like [Rhodopseudomonas palustris BisB5]SEP36102.1 hypothetical protein SAMN05444123_11755 [Rhodopseudomonas pseudopalustris]